MSEVVYNILDYNGTISNKSFKDIINELDSKGFAIDNAQLSEEQLKTFLSILYVYGMHYDIVENDKRTSLLKTIAEEKLPLFLIPKKFCLHLLNGLETSGQTEFGLIQNLKHDLSHPLSNERLLDFVEMELMDVSESYRKWEYGRFVIENISEYLFKDIKWDRTVRSIDGNSQ